MTDVRREDGRRELKPDVDAKYRELVADFKAGKTDEHDVLGPMKKYLAQTYPA